MWRVPQGVWLLVGMEKWASANDEKTYNAGVTLSGKASHGKEQTGSHLDGNELECNRKKDVSQRGLRVGSRAANQYPTGG